LMGIVHNRAGLDSRSLEDRSGWERINIGLVLWS
jgi:hypothetical protein